MKLYTSIGPNPHIVRMFIAEKGLDIPNVAVDLMAGENRKAPFLSTNAAGQLPALELDDGTIIAEVTAICEYIEELHQRPALFGTTAKERAETRMWHRRFDLNIAEPLAVAFRNAEGLALFKSRIPTAPEVSPGLKMIAQDRMKWFSDLIGPRQFIAGDRFTFADIFMFCFLEFGAQVGQKINPEAKNLIAIFERVKARASAKA